MCATTRRTRSTSRPNSPGARTCDPREGRGIGPGPKRKKKKAMGRVGPSGLAPVAGLDLVVELDPVRRQFIKCVPRIKSIYFDLLTTPYFQFVLPRAAPNSGAKILELHASLRAMVERLRAPRSRVGTIRQF